MPHISKKNIYKLACMSNEVKFYLQSQYPELFISEHDEIPIQKAERLYKKGTTFKNMMTGDLITFNKKPRFTFSMKEDGVFDRITGYLVFHYHTWAEIIEP